MVCLGSRSSCDVVRQSACLALGFSAAGLGLVMCLMSCQMQANANSGCQVWRGFGLDLRILVKSVAYADQAQLLVRLELMNARRWV